MLILTECADCGKPFKWRPRQSRLCSECQGSDQIGKVLCTRPDQGRLIQIELILQRRRR
jgi:hypothetical protein